MVITGDSTEQDSFLTVNNLEYLDLSHLPIILNRLSIEEKTILASYISYILIFNKNMYFTNLKRNWWV